MSMYSGTGEGQSIWQGYEDMAVQLGLELSLKGRATPRRPNRADVLTIRGEECRTLYRQMVVDLSDRFKYSFASVLLPEGAEGMPQDQTEEVASVLDPDTVRWETQATQVAFLEPESETNQEKQEQVLNDAIDKDPWQLLGSVKEEKADYDPPEAEPVGQPEASSSSGGLPRLLDWALRLVTEEASDGGISPQVGGDAVQAVDELLKMVDKWSPTTFMVGPPRATGAHEHFRAVHFCTTCLWRHYQFKKALLVNVLMMSLYRLQNPVDISWHIVLARDGGEGASLILLSMARPLLEAAGVEVDIGFADLTGTDGWFHMSWATNSSHMMAVVSLEAPGEHTHILVNLDCDNTIGSEFIGQLSEAFRSPVVWGIHAQGHESGTTGRVCVRLSKFVELRGYDQEPGIQPSGYQDIDFKVRLAHLQGKKTIHKLQVGPRQQPQDYHRVIGMAIANDSNAKRDRGASKVLNTSAKDKPWGRMNNENHEIMARKLKERPSRQRNETVDQLGWPCVIYPLRDIPTTSPSSWTRWRFPKPGRTLHVVACPVRVKQQERRRLPQPSALSVSWPSPSPRRSL